MAAINVYNLQVSNEHGRAVTGMHEWTSLTQSQILLILRNLPDKLSDPEPHASKHSMHVVQFPEPHASKIGALCKV